MLKLLRNLLDPPSANSVAVENFSQIQIATCALLLEMAHTDEEFHGAESVLIEDLLQSRFALSSEASAALMERAHKERDASLDLYAFAREINDQFSIADKIELVEELWRVVYADGLIDKYEEYLMRQLTSLLRLSHRQMIDAKLKVRDELAADPPL